MSNQEEKARAQGWVPQEEYKGDSDNWKTAEQFIEVGEKISGVQKERNDRLLDEVKKLTQQVSGYQNQFSEFKDIHSKELAAVREDSYNKALLKLKEKQVEAVENADVEEFEKTQAKIDNLKKPEKPETTKDPVVNNAPPKEFVEFADKNKWYSTDKDLTEYADFIGSREAKNHSDPASFYAAVESKVKAQFPDKFKVKEEVPDVESSSSGTPTKQASGKHKFKDLPEDAKKACKKYVAAGLYKSEAEYMKEYHGE
ncbi:MAG: hypothetical protein GY714_18055 [Desulfobacterales bacterium]|nr:hypothetical protein [Desulfobacterales bacterium]